MANQSAAQAPEQAVKTIDSLDALLKKVDLTAPDESGDRKTSQGRLTHALNLLVDAVTNSEAPVERVDKVLVDKVVSELDKKITNQVNEILHHKDFQQMESSWRGLDFLVKRTDFRRNVKIEMLNASKEELLNDFEEVPELIQSGLFKHMYEQEYDQAGGEPFGAILGNYEFENTGADHALLRELSKVAASCHAPFIGSVGASFFGQEDMQKLALQPDVTALFDQDAFAKWNSFRETEDSRYVGLTLPRFLLRLPYGPETRPAKNFHFVEDASGETHNNYLWGNGSYAFGSCLTRSFAEHGWCVNIRGPQSGGLVEDLPLHLYEASGGTTYKVPTEVLVSDRREYELAELGFIPLAFYKSKDYACFFSANSSQKPKEYTGKDGDYATSNSRLSSRLPYLFLVSRLAHYVKVMQRENIGSSLERDELQLRLQDWIGTLVTEMPSPTPELKARCPLSAAQIEVMDVADNPGFYKVDMKVRPHFQIEGIDVNLSLVSRLPKAKN
ncbi:MAG: type VI secretion system contractile sheath large subunit [Acidobacteriota bacterium]